MFGISAFSAVINPPQACILAVGSGVARVVSPADPSRADARPRVATTVTVQLSADRRVVDEALASKYLQVRRRCCVVVIYPTSTTHILMSPTDLPELLVQPGKTNALSAQILDSVVIILT